MAIRKICHVAIFCCSVFLLPSMSVGDCTFDDSELELDGRSPYDTNPSYTWPKGQIPYVFTKSVGYYDKQLFKKNMALIEEHTCFKYIERKNSRQKYLEINVVNKGTANSCANGQFAAYVTNRFVRSENKMYLHSDYQLADASSCRTNRRKSMFEGGILHEMFHALGVMHTQKRKDRDNYVQVNKRNIQDPSQYSICWNCKIFPGTPYECNSIMHYGTKTLGKQGAGPTMTSRSNTCRLQPWGYSTPTDNDWKLLKTIADRVCSVGSGGGSGTGGGSGGGSGTGGRKRCDENLAHNNDCCTKLNPCGVGEGDCDDDHDCKPGLKCGTDNCSWESGTWGFGEDDCCERK